MPRKIRLTIDGEPITAEEGITIAAAILNQGKTQFRRSETGEPRGPICGMGICFECRVVVNGHRHVRACLTECQEGMVIESNA